MKCYDDMFEPFEVLIKNVEGEEFELKTRFMSSETYNKILELSKDFKDDPTKAVDLIFETLHLLFGKEKKFFKQFSLGLLETLSHDAISSMKNKTKSIKKKKK